MRIAHEFRQGSVFSRVIATAAGLLMPAVAAASDPPSDLALTLFEDGFTRPVAVRHAGDGTGRLFVVDLAEGEIFRFESSSAIFTDLFESGDAARWTSVVGD